MADPIWDRRGAEEEEAESLHSVHHRRYYGDGIVETGAESPRYPVMLHVGKVDTGIPKEHWEKVLRIHPTLPVHGYPAGHGFSCGARGSGREPSARLARERRLGILPPAHRLAPTRGQTLTS